MFNIYEIEYSSSPRGVDKWEVYDDNLNLTDSIDTIDEVWEKVYASLSVCRINWANGMSIDVYPNPANVSTL